MDIKEAKWKIYRLKAMKPFETVYRVKQLVQKKYEKALLKLPRQNHVDITEVKVDLGKSNINFAVNSSSFSLFGKEVPIDDKIDFLKDYFTGLKFPQIFSKDINIRAKSDLSAKRVWETNRLTFLLPLLIDYKYNEKKECLDLFVSIMQSWDQQNPYLKGINWYSNIEVNIRLINWYWCWLLLQDDVAWNKEEKYKTFKEQVWLPLIYKHYYYCYHNLSLYSSANNHLIAEYAGLFIASTLWKFKESEVWLLKSKQGLEEQILKQNSSNGINKEESAEYIQFITDFFLVAYVVGAHHQISFSEEYKNRLVSICDYINSFLDVKGNYPKYGDDDDGKLLIPDGNSCANNFISILNTGAILLDKPEFKRKGSFWDLKSNLLTTHIHGYADWDTIPGHSSPANSRFYEEGHFIFRKKQGEDKEIYCHFDAAPLGFLAIAAHGHSDALSFMLHLDGEPVFVDPGTFCYHTDLEWRRYFLSSLAHNTITINNDNQAKYVGPTLWLNHYNAAVKETKLSDTYDCVIAEHDGYKNYKIKHIRKVEFFKSLDHFVITDEIVNPDGKEITINLPFHIHPKFDCSLNNNTLQLDATLRKVRVILDEKLKWRLLKGDTSPILGWYSESFYKKDPCQVCIGFVKTDTSIFISCQVHISDISSPN